MKAKSRLSGFGTASDGARSVPHDVVMIQILDTLIVHGGIRAGGRLPGLLVLVRPSSISAPVRVTDAPQTALRWASVDL